MTKEVRREENNGRKGSVGKKNEMSELKEQWKARWRWKKHAIGVKENKWSRERELCLLVLQWRETQISHVCKEWWLLLNCTAGHQESKTKHTGKADK